MPKNSIHGEAVKALVSDPELREAMVDVGVSVRVLDDPASQECTALMLGIRLTLVPDFKSQFDTLGVQVSDMEYADSVTEGIAVAKLIINRRDPTKPAAKASEVRGLSSLGDLRDPPTRRFFVVEEVEAEVRAPFCRPCGEYHDEDDCEYDEDEYDDEDDDEYVEAPRTIPLTVSVATLSAAKALEVVAALIPVLANNIGAYAVGGSHADDYGATVELNPIGDTNSWVRRLPSGTVIFDNPVTTAENDVFDTKVLVAGEVDPNRPPYEIADFIQRRVGNTAPEIERLVLELTRLDGAAFTEAQLIDPLNKAVLVISDKFGPITVLETEEGDSQNVRRASLRLDGTGELDPRILTQGIAGFDGTVPFPGIGQVRSRLIGGE